MKILKKTMCLIIVVLMLLSVAACVPESSKNIAKINGEKIKKSEFNDYYNVMMIMQEAYGYTLPETEEDIAAYKEIIVEEFVRSKLVELYNNDNGITNDVSIDEAKDEIVDLIKAKQEDDAAFETYLETKGYTLETFDSAITEFLVLNNAVTAFYDSGSVSSEVLGDDIVLTVGDVEFSREMFNYFMVNFFLERYVNGQSNTIPSADTEIAYYFELIKENYLAFYAAIYDYGVKNGYELTEEEIQQGNTKFGAFELLFGEETMNAMYNKYFVNKDNVEEYAAFAAKLFAMSTKIENEFNENYNPTEEDLKTYYDNCADTVFGDKVSAYHILTEDEDRAKELLEESKGTPEGFMEIYEKYSSSDNTDESIVEAADLGSFYHRAMVQEFSDAAFSMEIGEVKGMVKSEFGYHLIYVYDKTDAKTWENDHDDILATYIQANRSSWVYNQLDKIYDSCKIKNGDYRTTPNESLMNWLKDQYKTKIYYYNLED